MQALSVAAFLAADAQTLVERLAFEDMQRFRRNEAQQLRAWAGSIACLRRALRDWPAASGWQLILEYPMRRLGRRIDAVLVTPRALVVLEFKVGATSFDAAAARQVEDYALDLQDFHSASRDHPIVPVLIATEATTPLPAWPLLLAGVAPVMLAASNGLRDLLDNLWARLPVPAPPIDVIAWADAPYRPVPGIVDAACTLYARHNVADIGTAGADAHNLTTTTQTILEAIADAERHHCHIILFVTGIPGAGKTLCGLNAVFGTGRDGASFLTGNPTLVHVLREALARDAAGGDRKRLRAARQRTKVAIQKLPAFRDTYVKSGDAPPEHVIIIDEAQRAWAGAQAIRKSATREVPLTDSEPGHLLDIMARRADWAVIVCLVGNGQEIHDGEGGLAEWGLSLATRPQWQIQAAPATRSAADPRQLLPALDRLRLIETLHLQVPMRSLRNPAAAAWVDAVVRGNATAARDIADDGVPIPFLLTRDLTAMRKHLRAACRGARRAGLVGSSGGKRRRADGLGAEVPHMDEAAVARWFLDRWPDVRASDALETVATEFACQGLELDHVGLCWGGDLLRVAGQNEWRVRDFVGTGWTIPKKPEAITNRINTYRVLLTRARYQTVIWVPEGDAADRSRSPLEFDAIADFLRACGALLLADAAAPQADTATIAAAVLDLR